MKTQTRTIIKTIVIVVIILGSIFGFKFYRVMQAMNSMSNYAQPPETVTVMMAEAKQWQSFITGVGSLDAIQGVDISSQVAGLVDEIYVNSGESIKKNEVILKLNTDVLESQLRDRIAAYKLADLTHQRNRKLFEEKAVSKASLDTSQVQLEQAQAGIDLIKAQINQMTIKAPFSGRLGILKVNLGQFLEVGRVITNLQQIAPIKVNLSVSQQGYSQLFIGQPIVVQVDAYPKQEFQGKITAIDAQFDEKSRAIALEAELPNEKGLLLPGMFVSIKIFSPEKQEFIVVPESALTYTLHGNSVFVIEKKKDKDKDKEQLIAKRRYIQIGEKREHNVAVLSGLKKGELIVTTGQLKLHDDSVVIIDKENGLAKQ